MARRTASSRGDLAIAVEGLRPLLRALKHTEDRLDKNLKLRLKEIARPVADRAKRNAPKRSGRLAGSIKTAATLKGAAVRSTLVYAPIHEYGGRTGRGNRIRASRFMERAVQSSQGDVELRARRLLDDIADDYER